MTLQDLHLQVRFSSLKNTLAGCGNQWNDFWTASTGMWAGSYYIASFDFTMPDYSGRYFDSVTTSDYKIEKRGATTIWQIPIP